MMMMMMLLNKKKQTRIKSIVNKFISLINLLVLVSFILIGYFFSMILC